jgi:hypothetical protein
MFMKNFPAVIKELEAGLTGGNAHVSFEDAVKNIPHAHLGMVPEGLPAIIRARSSFSAGC